MPRESGASSNHLSCRVGFVTGSAFAAARRRLMKLSDLLTGLAPLDARPGAIEATGVTADSRKVKRGDVFVAVPGTKADGLSFAAQAAAAGAAAIVGEGEPPALPPGAVFVKVDNARRALSLIAARIYPRQPQGDRRGDRHQRQDLGRGLHPADLGGARIRGRQRRHHRRRHAEARGLWLADHARSGRPASHAVGTGRRGRHASGDRGVVARARPAPARRRAGRGRRLHQSEPRSSRLSSERRGLSRGQAPAVRCAGGRRRRRGDRRRSRAQRCGGRGGEEARAEADHGRPQGRRHPPGRHRHRRIHASRHASSTPASAISSGCRWSAASRSRTRWSRRGLPLRPAARPDRVFAALASLKGAKGRLDLVGDRNGAPVFVDYAHKPDALEKAHRGAAALRQTPARRGVRRRRRPRQGQARR